MNTYTIKTFHKSNQAAKPHFYILNKGMNSGKPLRNACPNCFILTCHTEEQREFYYWITFGLWRSNAFHPYLRGSVVPFIIKKEVELCIQQGETQARKDIQAFEKAIQTLKFLELKEKQFHQNLKLIEDARKAIFYKYHRSHFKNF